MKNSLVNGAYEWSVRFSAVVYLHLLWVLFTFIGLGVFGLFPSTAALYSVIRKRSFYQTDVPVFKTFVNAYKKGFWELNSIMFVFLAFGFFLYFDYRISVHVIHSLIFHLLLLFLIAIYVSTLILFFPVYIHFDLKSFSYLKQTLYLVFARPLEVLFSLAMLIFVWGIVLYVPFLIVLFGMTLFAYPVSWIIFRAFRKIGAT